MPAAERPLKILMLAPEPFFEPRGTPFSEYHRIKALVELGHQIDLVTYPIGADVELPNLRIIRSARPPFVRRIRVGPSFPKVLLDACLAFTAWRQTSRDRYDLIHSHEEAGALGVFLARRAGIPHVYDMHSSLPQQLSNFRYTRSRLVKKAFEIMERWTIAGSDVVVTICQDLQDRVTELGAGERAVLIENVMGGDVEDPPTLTPAEIRRRWQIGDTAPVVLYTGTLEPYQGIDLLFEAAAIVGRTNPAMRLLVAGGRPDQIELARATADRLGAPAVFVGHQPAREVPAFIQTADILASPRISGTNTPLKIYSYLRSGKPIVATDLLTHTQVLDRETALLVAPDAVPFAQAIQQLLDDPVRRERLARAASDRARARYSRDVYVARTRHVCDRLDRRASYTRVAAVPRA
jgi:glycosyltransferase involved in cell wall biosynthesis